jgi:protein required for attachment to host cells
MPSIWILSANGASASIFSANSPTAAMVEVASLKHPEARSKEMELTSDRPGRTFDSFGTGRHAKSSEVGPRETEQIRFAREVVDRLDQGRVGHALERLVVVAAPAVLGHLRDCMSAPLASAVSLEIDKNYTALALGVQPGIVAPTPGLSDAVAGRLPDLVRRVVERLAEWGHEVRPGRWPRSCADTVGFSSPRPESMTLVPAAANHIRGIASPFAARPQRLARPLVRS